MTTVILVAHILVSIILIVVVLMQRSEGGALGIGGGGGGGGGAGLMSGRGVTGALVRTTIIFGAIFFISSLTLTTLATKENADGLTDVERELVDDQPAVPVEDDLGLGDLGDIVDPGVELADDPLAVVPDRSGEETPEDDGSADPQ